MQKFFARTCLLSIVTAAALVYGCSTSSKHPPLEGECVVGDPCGTSGGGGIGGRDGGDGGDAKPDGAIPGTDAGGTDGGGVG